MPCYTLINETFYGETTMKKTVILLICLSLCVSFVSCSQHKIKVNKNKQSTDGVVTEHTQSNVTEPDPVVIDINAMKKIAVENLNAIPDYDLSGGVTIASTAGLVYSPNSNATVFTAAQEERNELFAAKYGADIIQFSDDKELMLKNSYLNLLSGIKYTDLFSLKLSDVGSFAQKGVLLPVDSLPGADFGADYFDSRAMESCSAGMPNYVVMGEFTRDYNNYQCIYLNCTLLENAGIELPFDKVKDGSWTWDALLELTRSLNTVNTEVCAITAPSVSTLADVRCKSGDFDYLGEDDSSNVIMKTSDMYSALTQIRALHTEGRAVYDNTSVSGGSIEEFKAGKALFCIASVGDMSSITTMKDRWGILPLPKADINQSDYYSYMTEDHAVIAVYAGTDSEYAYNAVRGLNAASSGGYITQSFYNELINTCARDSLTFDMLDYIYGVKGGVTTADLTQLYSGICPQMYDYTRYAFAGAVTNPLIDINVITDNGNSKLVPLVTPEILKEKY